MYHRYKGYTYHFEDEREPDLVKRFHYVTNPEGEESLIDFSPYSTLTLDAFQKWIDLGMPKRREGRVSVPLNNDTIQEMWEENSRRFIMTD